MLFFWMSLEYPFCEVFEVVPLVVWTAYRVEIRKLCLLSVPEKLEEYVLFLFRSVKHELEVCSHRDVEALEPVFCLFYGFRYGAAAVYVDKAGERLDDIVVAETEVGGIAVLSESFVSLGDDIVEQRNGSETGFVVDHEREIVVRLPHLCHLVRCDQILEQVDIFVVLVVAEELVELVEEADYSIFVVFEEAIILEDSTENRVVVDESLEEFSISLELSGLVSPGLEFFSVG